MIIIKSLMDICIDVLGGKYLFDIDRLGINDGEEQNTIPINTELIENIKIPEHIRECYIKDYKHFDDNKSYIVHATDEFKTKYIPLNILCKYGDYLVTDFISEGYNRNGSVYINENYKIYMERFSHNNFIINILVSRCYFTGKIYNDVIRLLYQPNKYYYIIYTTVILKVIKEPILDRLFFTKEIMVTSFDDLNL